MKPIPIALSPTRSRALNVFLGLVLALVSVLLFLALATYHPADPSLNTATDAVLPRAVHNWIGLFGAWLSDLLLQSLGITAFLVAAVAGRRGLELDALALRRHSLAAVDWLRYWPWCLCPPSSACCPGTGAGCTRCRWKA